MRRDPHSQHSEASMNDPLGIYDYRPASVSNPACWIPVCSGMRQDFQKVADG